MLTPIGFVIAIKFVVVINWEVLNILVINIRGRLSFAYIQNKGLFQYVLLHHTFILGGTFTKHKAIFHIEHSRIFYIKFKRFSCTFYTYIISFLRTKVMDKT